MFIKRKIIYIIFFIILVVLGFLLFAKPKQASYQFVQVKKQDIQSTILASGSLTGKDTANLKFKISGKLSYVSVKAGDLVKKGQVVAGLDTQDLEIALQQARNTLTDKQATVDKVHDDVKDHDKDESFTMRQTRTTAEAASNNAYDSVKAAQRAFQDAVITSPIAGTVTQVTPLAGQNVSVTDTIAQIVDTTEIYFDADVDEADFGQIKVGLSAEVALDAYPDKVFTGSVDKILPTTETTSQGATVVTVRIKLNNPDLIFVNGLTGDVQIVSNKVNNVLTIPQEAIREDSSVVVKNGSGFIAKKVISGISSDTDLEITKGLIENEQTLINPPGIEVNLASLSDGNIFDKLFKIFKK